jgi:hypothetical protein
MVWVHILTPLSDRMFRVFAACVFLTKLEQPPDAQEWLHAHANHDEIEGECRGEVVHEPGRAVVLPDLRQVCHQGAVAQERNSEAEVHVQ